MKKILVIVAAIAVGLTGCVMSVQPDANQQCALVYHIIDGQTTTHDLFRVFGPPVKVLSGGKTYLETRLYIMPTSEFTSLRAVVQLQDGIVKNHACSNWGRAEGGARPW